MTHAHALQRHEQEILFCERILAKSGETVLTATLANVPTPTYWTHYPTGDVYDVESGAHWYYHSHANTTEHDGQEHGHFHCFVHPAGREGPIHHLIAIGVDEMGKPIRLFTVAQHVVNDASLDAEARIALLEQFDIQLSHPNYLVNRWLTAIVALYRTQITRLIRDGSHRESITPEHEVTAELALTI